MEIKKREDEIKALIAKNEELKKTLIITESKISNLSDIVNILEDNLDKSNEEIVNLKKMIQSYENTINLMEQSIFWKMKLLIERKLIDPIFPRGTLKYPTLIFLLNQLKLLLQRVVEKKTVRFIEISDSDLCD